MKRNSRAELPGLVMLPVGSASPSETSIAKPALRESRILAAQVFAERQAQRVYQSLVKESA